MIMPCVLALACCKNRREMTLSSLTDLSCQQGRNITFSLSVFLVDDASSDDTSRAVATHHPDVTVIPGNGNLYWAGGMRYGWDTKLSKHKFDYLFVFNDDIRLYSFALSHLLEVAREFPNIEQPFAVVGTVVDPQTGIPTYGGRKRSSRLHPLKFEHLIVPNDEVQHADVFNMNAALISRSALESIGFLSPYFVHSGADFEFGLRLRQSGGVILVSPGVVGTCSPNPLSDSRQPLPRTISGRIRYLLDPKREPPGQRWQMYRHHGGAFWFLLFLIPYISVWLPQWRKR